jgi:hypothetical protein
MMMIFDNDFENDQKNILHACLFGDALM